jgi:tellurite resistance protein TehA-like permease
VLWVIVTYGQLAVLIAKAEKPALDEGLNGTWLVSVVATQAVAILTVLVAAGDSFAGMREPMLFMALALWLGGGAIYFLIIPLIFYRYMFVRMAPADLTPPYWIDMGAAAISTLAGAMLAEHAALSPLVGELTPFVKGFTLLYWSIASWWIPMLVVLGTWRHLAGGVPLAYDPLCWGGVFPLGMYSVATYELMHIIQAPFLSYVSQAFLIIAFVAWSAAIIGLLDTRLGNARCPPS